MEGPPWLPTMGDGGSLGLELSFPVPQHTTQPLPKNGPNLIDDLGLPVLMSVVNETWTGQPHPNCFHFQGADIIIAGFFFIIVYPEPRIPIRDRLAAWPDIVQSNRLTQESKYLNTHIGRFSFFRRRRGETFLDRHAKPRQALKATSWGLCCCLEQNCNERGRQQCNGSGKVK